MSTRNAILIVVLALSPGVCRAEANTAGNLQEVLKSAADEVLKITKNQPVAIGQITPTGLPDANGGPALADLLKQALEALQPGIVRRVAPFEIKGDYLQAPHPDKAEADLGQKVVKLILHIIDTASGEDNNLRLTRFLVDNTSIGRFLAPSGPLPLDPTKNQVDQKHERNQTLQDLLAHPRTFVDPAHPTLIGTTEASPFRIEIVAGPLGDGRTRPTGPRPARIENDLAYVEVQRNELYEIKLHNNSPDEAAVQLFIDGLSVFHFSEDRAKDGQPRLAYFIIPPRTTETIQGWQKSLAGKKFLSFLVTEYGKGASSQPGVTAQGPIGVIQAQFSRCYPLPPNTRQRSPANETGFGPPRLVEQKEVFREIEPPIDLVSVRYTR